MTSKNSSSPSNDDYSVVKTVKEIQKKSTNSDADSFALKLVEYVQALMKSEPNEINLSKLDASVEITLNSQDHKIYKLLDSGSKRIQKGNKPFIEIIFLTNLYC